MRYAIIIASTGFLALGGCASTPEVRSLAEQSGRYVQSLSDGGDSFIAESNQLNAQDESRLQQMASDTAWLNTQAREQHLAWFDAGDTTRVQDFDQAVSVSADQIVSGMTPVAPTPVSIPPVKGGYDASIKAMAAVSKKPKSWDQLKELYNFGASVRDAYANLKDAAKQAAADAAAKATSKDINAAGKTGQVSNAVTSAAKPTN
jgi:hypothetical protein